MKKTLSQKLFQIRKEIATLSKDTKNPYYNSKYFDINSLIKQIDPILEKYNVLLTQPLYEDNVETRLTCIESEQSVFASIKLPQENNPQKIGSAITYYRRYTLQSLLALQAVDDDANLASIKPIKNTEKQILDIDSDLLNKAIKHIENGGSLKAITEKYHLTKEVEQKLKNI